MTYIDDGDLSYNEEDMADIEEDFGLDFLKLDSVMQGVRLA